MTDLSRRHMALWLETSLDKADSKSYAAAKKSLVDAMNAHPHEALVHLTEIGVLGGSADSEEVDDDERYEPSIRVAALSCAIHHCNTNWQASWESAIALRTVRERIVQSFDAAGMEDDEDGVEIHPKRMQLIKSLLTNCPWRAHATWNEFALWCIKTFRGAAAAIVKAKDNEAKCRAFAERGYHFCLALDLFVVLFERHGSEHLDIIAASFVLFEHLGPVYEVLLSIDGSEYAPKFIAISAMLRALQTASESEGFNSKKIVNVEGVNQLFRFLTVLISKDFLEIRVRRSHEEYISFVLCVERTIDVLQEWMSTPGLEKGSLPHRFLKSGGVVALPDIARNCMAWAARAVEAEDAALHRGVLGNALDYIGAATKNQETYEHCLREEASTFIADVLFDLLALTSEEEPCFRSSDPASMEQFHTFSMAQILGKEGIRNHALSCIQELCATSRKRPFQDEGILFTVLGLINDTLDADGGSITADDDEAAGSRTFGVLSLLTHLHDVLQRKRDVYNEQLHDMLVCKVIPIAHSNAENTAVRHECVRVSGAFSACPTDNEENFQAVIDFVLDSLTDEHVPQVKIAAIGSIATIGSLAKRAKKYMRRRAAAISEEIIVVMFESESPKIVSALGMMIDNFGPELHECRVRIVTDLCKYYRMMNKKYHELSNARWDSSSSSSNSDFDTDDDDDDDDDGDEDHWSPTESYNFATHSAMQCLNTIVLSSEHEQDAAKEYLPTVLNLVGEMLDNYSQHSDSISGALELIQHGVYVAEEPTADEAWAFVPKLCAYILGDCGDLENAEAVLDNMISFGTEAFVKSPETVKAYFDFIEAFVVPVPGSTPALQYFDHTLMPQLIQAILHACRAEPHCTHFDEYFPRVVGIVQRGIFAEAAGDNEEKNMIWLGCNICDAFWYNPRMTLQVILAPGTQELEKFFTNFFGFFFKLLKIGEKKNAKKAVKKSKQKGTKKAKKFHLGMDDNEDEDGGDCPLSLLNRKIIAVGMTSLLTEVTTTTTAEDAASAPAAYPIRPLDIVRAAQLAEFCITSNAARYEKRVGMIRTYNAKRVAEEDDEGWGTESDGGDEDSDGDDDDYYDDDEEMEDDSDDSGDDIIDSSNSDDDDDDEGANPLGELEDEGDDFSSALDEVNEATTFLAWLGVAMKQTSSSSSTDDTGAVVLRDAEAVHDALQSLSTSKKLAVDALAEAETIVDEHITVVKELGETTKSQHDKRIEQLNE